ncbi:MAG: helix-turn-helix domain-containing protein [Methylobacter sp.]|nr:helix-turn-helix domain-containing protein [Methylobacter sp.]
MLNKNISIQDDIIINTEQASVLLCTAKSTLIKWRSTGENNIPYIKIGRNVRYRVSDLRKWIENHSRT